MIVLKTLSAFFSFMFGFTGVFFLIMAIYERGNERSIEFNYKNNDFMLALSMLIPVSGILARWSASAIGMKLSSGWNNYALVAGLVSVGIYWIVDGDRWKE